MSAYVDKFIKQHREYFKRNESFIKNNNWNKSSNYEEEIEYLKNELKRIQENFTGKDLDKEETRITKEIAEKGISHQTKKDTLFKQENELTSSIVGRLKSFISNTEANGERSLKKVQDFIEFTAGIIDIHIKKCEEYLDYQMDAINEETETEGEIEYRGQEIKFQDKVFTNKIKIQDTLEDLNLQNNIDNIKVKFFKDEKASLIMKEPLMSNKYQDIKETVQKIQVDWNIITSNEMFINMNPKDIPKWNHKKHFFEQDPVVLQFWTEEYSKIIHGLTINGIRIHPWLYFHLNFFKTPIPQKDSTEPIINPPLRDNEWFMAENIKNAEVEGMPNIYKNSIMVFGSRRYSKSTIIASIAHWKGITKANSSISIQGGSTTDLNSLTSKINTSMESIVLPFYLKPIKQNWEGGETTFGIKEDASTPIIYSRMIVQNLEQGTKKSSSQKTAGGAPSVSINDEVGKYSFKNSYLAELPAYETPYGYKTLSILSGTSGEASLSKDAMDLLSNPELYKVLPMDWDLLENNIDPEYITWKRRTYATFIPGQMAYFTGFKSNEKGLGEYLNIESKELDEIKIQAIDWKVNKEVLEDEIKRLRKQKNGKAKKVLQQQQIFYPLDPEDTFISGEDNPFPVEAALKKRKFLEDNEITGEKVFLYKDEKGRINTVDASDKELPDFPYQGGFIDSPVVIYERPHERVEESYSLYISGYDDYNQEESDGDSVGSLCIYKRNIMDNSSDKIVAMYNARPDPHRKFHEQSLLLLEMYNAQMYMENEDTKFKDYLDTKYLADKWLVKGFDPGTDFTFNHSGRRKYGWQPTGANVKFMMGRLLEYCHEIYEEEDEEGRIITKYGVERIDDIGILNEIISYKKDGNFDRLRSFGSCLMYDHFLTADYQVATVSKPPIPDGEKPVRRRTSSLFSGGNRGFF